MVAIIFSGLRPVVSADRPNSTASHSHCMLMAMASTRPKVLKVWNTVPCAAMPANTEAM